MCDEIINATLSILTNVTNTIPKNVMSTVSTNSDVKKVTHKKYNLSYLHCFISNCMLVIISWHLYKLLSLTYKILGKNEYTLSF